MASGNNNGNSLRSHFLNNTCYKHVRTDTGYFCGFQKHFRISQGLICRPDCLDFQNFISSLFSDDFQSFPLILGSFILVIFLPDCAAHERALKQSLNTLKCVDVFIETLALELEQFGLGKEVSRVHKVSGTDAVGRLPVEAVELAETAVLAVVVPDIAEVVDTLPRRRADIVHKRSLISAFLIDRRVPVKTGLVGLEHPSRMLRVQDPKHRNIRFRETLGAKIRDKCVVVLRVLINPYIIRIQPTGHFLAVMRKCAAVIPVLALIYGHKDARNQLHVGPITVL